ncbi:hypothetical protein EPN18_02235 [bacterium]|nr:MAG: hypothetical protein EPN18_02235 [bacterium]
MSGHGEHIENDNAPKISGEITEKWWKLPFDTTTNFSILGLFFGKLFDRGTSGKRVDLTLDDR